MNGFNDKNIQVSVVFVQYNSDLEKVLLSLYALVQQKGINFEIIIADDASEKDNFCEIEKFFKSCNFSHYHLFKNKSNVGTVQNLINGMEISKGEYIFANSPGDILREENTLSDYYHFASKHKAECCFANLLQYEKQDDTYSIKSVPVAPFKPSAYNWYMPKTIGQYALFAGHCLAGPAFLRKREYALKYFTMVAPKVKYVEDFSSSYCSIMAGERIIYFDREILWYESGNTKSAEVSQWWSDAVNKDMEAARELTRQAYPNNRLYDFSDATQNKYLRTIKQ